MCWVSSKAQADYNSGTITDTAKVGVKAIDDKTLEIKFTEPAAYNIAIAGMWVAHAQPRLADRGRRLHPGGGRPLDRNRQLPGLWPIHPEGMGP